MGQPEMAPVPADPTPADRGERWATATQPLLFPPLYMIERFARCDVVVLMQEAQHSRQAEHSWVLLTSPTGPLKVSLPCKAKNRRPIDEIEVLDLEAWCNALRHRLKTAYGKQPGYAQIAPSLDIFLEQLALTTAADGGNPTLFDVSRRTMIWCCRVLGVFPIWHHSKYLVPERPADAVAWLAELAHAAGATDYVQGRVSIESYFTPGAFRRLGIRLWAQEWRQPGLSRLAGLSRLGGQPSLRTSMLDALLIDGPERLRPLIDAGAGKGASAGSVVELPDWA